MTAAARRRAALVLCAAATVMTGLTVHELAADPAGAFFGDALYAVLLFSLIGAAAPALKSIAVAGAAFGACAAVELFQLTGVPAELATRVPGAAVVLGTTFQWTDLAAYALGAAAAWGADSLMRRAAGSSRGAPTTPS